MHRATSSPHYTPPPMLNPLRQGTGLFAELGASLGDGSPDRLRRLDTPQINVGPAFQPVLPVLQDPHLAWLDPPQAEPVWRPWPRLEQDAETQRQVETLLDVACSSALPGGGTNQELALHCLFQAGGNVMVRVPLCPGPW
ncbi:zinc finger protein 541-like [Pelodiscus sinensis]|uniref:zinc finger protein 541-like n=1 Tax=Pelodiscus sinensis TaxID=13735 RepID=UPI003F6CB873